MTLSADDQERIEAIGQKLKRLQSHLNDTALGSELSLTEWHDCLTAMKRIVGNASNDMSTIACLMAKDYLYHKLPMIPYDALAKAHGANGINIDERTIDGRRVIGEIKTNGAFNYSNLRAEQKNSFGKTSPD